MNNITEIAEMVTEAIKADEGIGDLTQIEQATRQVMQQIGRQVITHILAESQPSYAEPYIDCDCGEKSKYVRQRTAQLHTMFGQMQVKRAYYLCKSCRQGYFPLDQKLGLRPNALSAELEQLVALTGVQIPFQKGRNLFESLTLVAVSDQSVSKATQQMGKIVTEKEAILKERSTDVAYLNEQKQTTRAPLRVYGAIDAGKVHIRDGENGSGWRDFKVGAWFEARGKPPTSPDGEWQIQAENINYYTDICPASDFSSLVWATGVEQHVNLAQELIILGDGAEWIWNIVTENFPDAIQILDWFHASEHLMPVAQAAFSDEQTRSQWVSQMRQLMWDGDTDKLIATCIKLAETNAHDDIRKAANYFREHKARMRYAYFRSQGYQIGSGTIESAAKQIGLMRMKVPGARWNEESARLVAKARATFLSNRWHELPLAV